MGEDLEGECWAGYCGADDGDCSRRGHFRVLKDQLMMRGCFELNYQEVTSSGV